MISEANLDAAAWSLTLVESHEELQAWQTANANLLQSTLTSLPTLITAIKATWNRLEARHQPTTERLAWMTGLRRGSKNKLVTQPWSIELDGEWWNFACNGHSIVAVQAPPAFERIGPGLAKPVMPLLNETGGPRAVSFAALKDFAGPVESMPCDSCHGDRCDKDGDSCWNCSGFGVEYAKRNGKILGCFLSRTLLARTLAGIDEAGSVEIGNPQLCMLTFRGSLWRAVVMGMRQPEHDGGATVDFSEAP